MGDPLYAGDIGLAVVLITLLKVVITFVLLLVSVMMMVWFERKIIADMQHRIGPNRAGPWGILQTLADGIKLFFKEDLLPERAERRVFHIAPLLALIPAFLAFSIIPLGGDFNGGDGTISMFGHRTFVQLADPPIGVLFVLAMSGIGVYGIMLAGWASGSKYPLLGSVRASAQIVSYEAALGLSLAAVLLVTGAVSTHDIVASQAGSGVRTRDELGGVHGRLRPRDHVHPRGDRRAQPTAVRPRRGRAGAGRRVQHRVQLDPLRALLPDRVHEHDHDVGAVRDAVLRRARPGRCTSASCRTCGRS